MNLLDNEYDISPYAKFLKKHGMISGALYYKNLNETVERKSARVVRYHLENSLLPQYTEGQSVFVTYNHTVLGLAPNDDINNYGFFVDMEGRLRVNHNNFSKLLEKAENPQETHIVNSILANSHYMNCEPANIRYSHGGLHNICDFEYILKNGFMGYKHKILSALAESSVPKDIEFYHAMLDVVEGIISFIKRYKEFLIAKYNNDSTSKETKDNAKLKRLIDAIDIVPLFPAQNFYQAFVSLSATMCISGQFETGRIDSLLFPYYEKDLAEKLSSKDEAIALFSELFSDIDNRAGHPGTTHITIGGTKSDNSPDYNELTEAAIIAIRGLRSPNVSLRVREDMPQHIWDLYLENIGRGYAQPGIVNEDLFLDGLTQICNIPFEDAINYAFGGCSELMIQGKTMCDSTWTAYNMLDIFENTMYNHLTSCNNFEEFYNIFKTEVCATLEDMKNQINIRQHAYGLHTPFPIQTLMVGDCIENRKSFTNGGAKYNFDSTNIYGTTNTINSLYTIKQFYNGAFGEMSKHEFLTMFADNFNGFEREKQQIKGIKKFGNHSKELNDLSNDLLGMTFKEINKFRCYRGNGHFMPAIIAWVTWIDAGQKVGATPDGRMCSEPLADSSGPVQGTDLEGPTALLNAVSSIPQKYCVGTCLLNLSLNPQLFHTDNGLKKVQALLATYFKQGGCQLQINVVDSDTLMDAMEHPENHRNIIVRVGGFSDNFVLLDRRIQEQILQRTQHS